MDYRSTGVDVSKNDQLVDRIKEMMGASGERIGHFGGAVALPDAQEARRLIVSSVDSVGTKVKIASALGKYDTIGQDLVHHCINDIACCGAEPLAFLDYYAASTIDVDAASESIRGVINACERWGVALVGGEAAEMPGVYRENEFDLVGTVIGLVDEDKYLTGEGISEGDLLLGFASNGLHTNGYSLARGIVKENNISYLDRMPGTEITFGDALLAIHRCYLEEIRVLKETGLLKGLAHITGGGIHGNVSRVIPKGLNAQFNWGCWSEPPVFTALRKLGNVPEDDMRRTFNLGIGLVAVVDSSSFEDISVKFPEELIKPQVVGRVVRNRTMNVDKSSPITDI